MIRSFAFRGQRIPLHPSPLLQTSRSLFAGDSMTLLVGPNGSGKTQALASLVTSLLSPASLDVDVGEVDWQVADESGVTCGIYYTSTPFEVSVPESRDRFIKLQPDQKAPIRNEEIRHELESEFGLGSRRELKLARAQSSIFDALFFAVTHWKDASRKNFLVNDPWIDPFRLLGNGTYDPKTGKGLRHDFEQAVRERLGPSFFMKFRAYLHAKSRYRKTLKTKAQLLGRLGFSIADSVSQAPGPASEDYTEILRKLQSVAEVLGVDDLANPDYLINDAQAAALDSLSLGSLGLVSYTGLSSGAAALIDQFTNIEIASRELAKTESNKHLLLLIDEGDAFLHLRWQQHYVEYLDKTVARLRKRFQTVQVVLATHSPVVMSDFPRECIAVLNSQHWAVDILSERVTATPDRSFGAPLDTVIRYVGGAGSLGSFSAKIMRELVDEIAAGKPVEEARIDMIDDLVIRRQIQRMLDERPPMKES